MGGCVLEDGSYRIRLLYGQQFILDVMTDKHTGVPNKMLVRTTTASKWSEPGAFPVTVTFDVNETTYIENQICCTVQKLMKEKTEKDKQVEKRMLEQRATADAMDCINIVKGLLQ